MVPGLRAGDAMTPVILGADTPRSHCYGYANPSDYRSWYFEHPTDTDVETGRKIHGPSPFSRHEAALAALPDLAYIREWGKQWKQRKPAKRAPKVSEVEALRARVAELEAALNRMHSIMEAA